MQNKLGRKLTNTEMQEVTDRLKIDTITKRGTFWDTKEKLYKTDPAAQLEIDIDDVPARDRAEITAALQLRKRPVTNENILKYFTQGLNRGNQ